MCVYQHAPTSHAPGIYRHRTYFAELVRRGWHVDLIATPINYMTGDVPPQYERRPYVHEIVDGIDMHWVWASRQIHASQRRRATNYATFFLTALARAATLPTPDIVLVSSPPLPVAALGPMLSLRFRRAPWLLEVRDIWPESAVSVGWLEETSVLYRTLLRVARYATHRAHAVIVPTPGLKDRVREHGARTIEVITGPVADEARTAETRARVRESLGVPSDHRLFLYLGALGVANGIDTLLDAAANIRTTAPATILLVGDGSGRRPLDTRITQDERLRCVRTMNPVPKNEVFDLLAASDVCLHLLRPDPVFETALPSKVLDYFSAHRPFITTAPGLPAKLAIESGGSHAANTDELTAAIERWTSRSTAEWAQACEQSYAYGAARFGIEGSVDRLERLLYATMSGSESSD